MAVSHYSSAPPEGQASIQMATGDLTAGLFRAFYLSGTQGAPTVAPVGPWVDGGSYVRWAKKVEEVQIGDLLIS